MAIKIMTQTIKERIIDVSHKNGDDDVRGACGSPCYGCWRAEEILKAIGEKIEPTYQVECYCMNCFNHQVVDFPTGKTVNEFVKTLICKRCGCKDELRKCRQ